MTPKRRASDDPLAGWLKVVALVGGAAGIISGITAFAWRTATQPLMLEVQELRKDVEYWQMSSRRQRADLLELTTTPPALVALRARAIRERWEREDAELDRKER